MKHTKTILSIITFFLIGFAAKAQVFEGLVNTDHKIRLVLKIEDESVTGTCLIPKENVSHSVKGTKDGSQIVLEELDANGAVVGNFTGSMMAGYMYKGDWKREKNGGKFMLTKVEGDLDSETDFLTKNTKAGAMKVKKTASVENVFNKYLTANTNCGGENANLPQCTEITAKAVNEAYGIKDFQNGDLHMTMGEMHEYVGRKEHWTKIGGVNQENINQAVKASQEGKLALLIHPYKGYSQVAVILDDAPTMSGKWGMKLPNIAVYYYLHPEKSFVGKKMSYMWSSAGELEIWVRNK